MIKNKIKSVKDLKSILSTLKEEGKKIVFTNGCFDILHVGHVSYLEEAKRHGDILVVAINSDKSTEKLKGKGRPIVHQADRLKMLASLESVDFATAFNEDDPGLIVKKLNPDVIVKGSDWKEEDIIGGEDVRKKGGKTITIPFLSGYSTTTVIKKVKELP
jgi:D-beta-D-heptose 7-phosphate kinase/D-beta-D-heptose 1-phosphate adenosyltransferase